MMMMMVMMIMDMAMMMMVGVMMMVAVVMSDGWKDVLQSVDPTPHILLIPLRTRDASASYALAHPTW